MSAIEESYKTRVSPGLIKEQIVTVTDASRDFSDNLSNEIFENVEAFKHDQWDEIGTEIAFRITTFLLL